jgi:hypothetical protein
MTKLPHPTPLNNLFIGPELAAHTAQLSSKISAKISELNNTLHDTDEAYKTARMFDNLKLDEMEASLPDRYLRLSPEERLALAQKEGIKLHNLNPKRDANYTERERLKDLHGGWGKDVVALANEKKRIESERDELSKLAAAFTTALRAPLIINATDLDLKDQKILAVYEGSPFHPHGHQELTSADIRLVVEYLKVKIDFELTEN